MTRREETRRVKEALRQAGVNAIVTHGRGTAASWLEIYIGTASQFGDHVVSADVGHRDCPVCRRIRRYADRAENIVAEVTGRKGEYANVLVLTQDHWDRKQGRTVEITQKY